MSTPRVIATVSAAVAAAAVPLLVHFEGEIRHGYRDPIGIVTSCIGHTGSGAELGRTYTAAECKQQLATDLAEHEAGLQACVHTDMPDNVHAAFLSFAFNVGVEKACNSTAIRYVNAGQYLAACAELSKWVNAGGKPLPGLVKRRAAERALCEGRPPMLGVQG